MKTAAAIREHIPLAPHEPPIRIVWMRSAATLPSGVFGYHPEIELQFLRRGSGVYTIRDRKYLLRAHSLLIIRPNELHSFTPTQTGGSFEKITFMLRASLAGAKLAKQPVRHMRLTLDEGNRLARLAADIRTEFDQRAPDWAAMCRLKVRELRILIRRAAAHPLEATVGHPAVARVLNLMDAAYAEPINNDRLARAAGVSISRLAHLFSEHTGVGLRQYLIQLRILKACAILTAEPGLKIEAVAAMVGFKYAADFQRAFKAHTRMTPSAYRASTACGL